MKRFFLSTLACACLVIILAFSANSYEPNHATAEVNKIEGFYIFVDSKPVLPYESLGDTDLGFVSGTQYESIRANLIKRARKNYPTADGLILSLNKKGVDKCNVIKFK